MENKNSLIITGAILGLSLIIMGSVMGYAFYKSRGTDTLMVTGSAKQQITSDTVKWVAAFTRTAPVGNLQSGYAQMKNDLDSVIQYLKSQGVKDSDIKTSAVFLDEQFKYNPQAPKQYDLRQTVEVNSSDVAKITDLAKNVQPFANKGIVFSTQSLEYYYSKLSDLRISLLSNAVKDAKARADKIAGATGKSVGSLQSATMGVVQVLPINSIEVSDYGTYDTSGIEKEVMVTVRTTFNLN